MAIFCVAGLTLGLFPDPSWAGVVEDAPEASEYTLLYELAIPDTQGLNLFGAEYDVDNTAAFESGFDRVAYHLELQKPGEERFFVYVSMPAQVLLPQETGIPTTVSGVEIQSLVDDVHVVSNHPELQALTSPLQGAVEFWPYNYTTGNAAAVPGATGELYDSGDTSAASGDYGSMQVHVAGTNQTLFAFNNWGGGFGIVDVGIGNAPASVTEHPDWTFAGNGDQYTLKTLRVLVRPGVPISGLSATMVEPDPHEVIQRSDDNTGTFSIAGLLKVPAEQVDGRLIPLDPAGAQGQEGPWEMVDEGPLGTTFSGSLSGTGGWYRMELRLWKNGEPFDVMVVEPLGIGEVFITSGQSNSANSGEVLLSPADPRVSAWGPAGWQKALDPQPIATGGGGTPWPALGDLLVERFQVPVGFISIGWGGTRVDQWLPFAIDGLYDRFLLALEEVGPGGARAILWHQGESDAYTLTSAAIYQERLETVIEATRGDGGWNVPWGVARASYLPGLTQESMDSVVAGQNGTIEADPLTFPGPYTDDMLGPEWRYDEVHFNEAGLIEHANRWNDAIELPPCVGLIPEEECPEEEPDGGAEEDAEAPEDAGEEEEDGEMETDTTEDTSEETSDASADDDSQESDNGEGEPSEADSEDTADQESGTRKGEETASTEEGQEWSANGEGPEIPNAPEQNESGDEETPLASAEQDGCQHTPTGVSLLPLLFGALLLLRRRNRGLLQI